MGEKKRRATSGALLLRDAQAMHRDGRLREAGALYEQALKIAPTDVAAWQGLAVVARAAGATDATLRILARAVARVPDATELRVDFAQALVESGRLDDAALELEHACRARPDDASNWQALGIVRQSLGETAAAADAYRRACALAPTAAARLKLATLVSPIPASRATIAAERERVDAELDALRADTTLHVDDPMQTSPWPNFYLAFHGENDRALQTEVRRRLPPPDALPRLIAPHCATPRRAAPEYASGSCRNSSATTASGAPAAG